jgi:LacI family transcriptional regulator
MSTIKDVAARAGVSFTTVSHVLNGTRRVSEEARARVEQAVAEMGYSPSAVARALKTSETFIFGVLVPDITNPFFAELTRGIEDRCWQTDYSVFLCNCDDDGGRQDRYLQTLIERRVDGLVLAAAAGEAAEVAKRLARSNNVPTVVVERRIPGLDADLVRIDHDAGARLAAGHLLEKGHRSIACLSGPSDFDISRERTAGWLAALREAGVEPRPEWMLTGDFSASAGYEMARSLLARGEVTAILAGNDVMAIGVLRAAAELGISVPEQLSVIGFDGIDLGGYVHPGLTSVGCPIHEMGGTTASLLLERLANREGSRREVIIKPRIIERQSVAAPPRT